MKHAQSIWLLLLLSLLACQPTTQLDQNGYSITAEEAKQLSETIRQRVAAEVDESLLLTLWASDSLVSDPIALDMDDFGKVYITRTNRQKNSEFDIRGYKDWEIASISFQTVEDRRAFLRKEFAPENSEKNKWFPDLNGDSSHDWRDLTVQQEQIFCIEDRDNDGLADHRSLFIEGFNDEINDPAGALLVHEDQVFLGTGPDMWRLEDRNKDGWAEFKESISHGYAIHIGFGAHGMSGAELGPDGRIYWGIGDIGFNGVGPDGKEWKYPNQGVIVRCNPDGSDFEVFSAGHRNTHEFVFDEYGNLISEDNDGDHPGESERLVYVPQGNDSGWRINWQFGKYKDPNNNRYKVWMDEGLNIPRHPEQPAYIVPCIRNYVNGPTGMLYNPGTALGPSWKDHFFIVEFVGNPARSAIHAFRLEESGAGFAFKDDKKILSGVLPTGMDFGPDGALYLADWIDGWGTKDYGRIWKLDSPKDVNSAVRTKTKELVQTNYAKQSISILEELLGYEDMRVRQKAQFELVRRGKKGIAALQKALASSDNQLSRIHAIWGIAQYARLHDRAAAELLTPYLVDKDPEIRAQTAKWIGDIRFDAPATQLVEMLKDPAPRARFFAAEALGRIAYEPAVSALIELLAANDDQDVYLRHAACLALSRINKAEPLVALSEHPSRAVRIGAVVALRRMRNPGVAVFLQDKDEYIVAETVRAIHDDFSITEAMPKLASLLESTTSQKEVIIRRALNANLRLGGSEHFARVANYAKNKANPLAMRQEATQIMGVWAKPSVLDRVDGRYRGELTRDLAMVQLAALPNLLELVKDKEAALRGDAAEAISKLKLKDAAETLAGLIIKESNPQVKATAVSAISQLEYGKIDYILQHALSDKNASVRSAAIEQLASGGIAPEIADVLLAKVIKSATNDQERQMAIASIGKLNTPIANATLTSLVDDWTKGKLKTTLQLDLAETLAATGKTELLARIHDAQKQQGTSSIYDQYSDCLDGGNAERGSNIYWQNESAQCTRCHAMFDYGSNVGPKLDGIANHLSKRQLLEALVEPSKRVSPGYGVVSLELKDGKEITGILKEETDGFLIIEDSNNAKMTVEKVLIVERIDGVSSMPPAQQRLSKREIRDLVAYLSTLTKEFH